MRTETAALSPGLGSAHSGSFPARPPTPPLLRRGPALAPVPALGGGARSASSREGPLPSSPRTIGNGPPPRAVASGAFPLPISPSRSSFLALALPQRPAAHPASRCRQCPRLLREEAGRWRRPAERDTPLALPVPAPPRPAAHRRRRAAQSLRSGPAMSRR